MTAYSDHLVEKILFVFPIDTRFETSSRVPKPWEFNVPAGTHYAIYYMNYGCGIATCTFPMQMRNRE